MLYPEAHCDSEQFDCNLSPEMWRKGGICHNVTEIISAHVQKESTVSRWQEAVAKLLFQLWDEKYSRILSWFSSYNIHSQHRIKCQPKLVDDARPGDERPGRVCWAYIKGSQWYKVQSVEVAVEIIMKNWIRAAVPNTHTWPSLRLEKIGCWNPALSHPALLTQSYC